MSSDDRRSNFVAVTAGGAAGLAADVILFPLDTIKTRLQSSPGFRATGGFSRIYAGLTTACIGSVPSACLFFFVYESGKHLLPHDNQLSVCAAAATGETAACLIRVPIEVMKQRSQADTSRSSIQHLKHTIRSEGVVGLYRGFRTMLMREIPFAFIQFPVWESLKDLSARSNGRDKCTGCEATICGAVAGAVAAAATNPLDVSKTRVMLAQKDSRMAGGSVLFALKSVFRESGVRGLFAGVTARVTWISIGGAIFLGGYETFAQAVESVVR